MKTVRALSIILSVVMLLSLLSVSAGAADHDLPFDDINRQEWYFEAVEHAYKTGLMNGIDGDTFAPNQSTTREQMVTALWRMNGAPQTEGELPFTDVHPNSFAKSAIVWATEQGIVQGVSATAFDPKAPITREQLVTLFHRYAALLANPPECDTTILGAYSDMRMISTFARQPFAWAVQNGIITGMTSQTLSPQGTATRAQIAAILQRFEQLSATPAPLDLPQDPPATRMSAIYAEK